MAHLFSRDGLAASFKETGGVCRLFGELSQGAASVLLLDVRQSPAVFRDAHQARASGGSKRARADAIPAAAMMLRGLRLGTASVGRALPAINNYLSLFLVGGSHLT